MASDDPKLAPIHQAYPIGSRTPRRSAATGSSSLYQNVWAIVRHPQIRHDGAMEIVGCPIDADETAEAYLLGRLPEEQSIAFENHFLGCPSCSQRLQFTEDFMEAVRRALARQHTKVAVVGETLTER